MKRVRKLALSIVVPTLNEEKYLGKLLFGLGKQVFKNFEVIIVDGRSEDKTLKIANGFKDAFQLKTYSSLRGTSVQRNFGAKRAKSDNLVFLDADGRLEDKFLEKLERQIRKENVYLATSWLRPDSSKLVDLFLFSVFNIFYLEFLRRFFPGSGGAFIYIERKIFNSVGGFDEKVKYAEDSVLVKRLNKKGYKLRVLRDLKVYTSVRRLESEGRLKFLSRVLRLNLRFLFKGPIKKFDKFHYEYGKF